MTVDLLHYRMEKETFTLFMGKSPEYLGLPRIFEFQNINLHSYYFRMSYLISVISKSLQSSLTVLYSDKLDVSVSIFIL